MKYGYIYFVTNINFDEKLYMPEKQMFKYMGLNGVDINIIFILRVILVNKNN